MTGGCCTGSPGNDDSPPLLQANSGHVDKSLCKSPVLPVVLKWSDPMVSAKCEAPNPLDQEPTATAAIAEEVSGGEGPRAKFLREMAECQVSAEATAYLEYQLSYDAASSGCKVHPPCQVIRFEDSGVAWLKGKSALLKVRIAKQSELPDCVPVGGEIQSKQGGSTKLEGDHLEFELVYDPVCDNGIRLDFDDMPLNLSSGPTRINPTTHTLEFVRADLGKCLRDVVHEDIKDPNSGEKRNEIRRSRWWVCIALLRFVCEMKSIDCKALSAPGGVPLGWAFRLMASGDQSQPPAFQQAPPLAAIPEGAQG